MIPANRTFFIGDNLPIMRDMDSESIDLIYIDPPFNSNAVYAAPTHTAKTEIRKRTFRDIWNYDELDEKHYSEIEKARPMVARVIDAANVGGESYSAYCVYMAVRLIEMHRLLKPTGSLYLHCDPTASHYLKMILDGIFGRENFRNEIIWCYTSPSRVSKHFPKKHDNILFYAKSKSNVFNKDDIRVESKWNSLGGYSKESVERVNKGKVPEDWWHLTFGPRSPERLGSPTQKSLAVLERIIKASSNENGLVLDAFAGCGTACVAANRLNRQWIGIDIDTSAERALETHMLKNGGRNPKINFDKSYIDTLPKEKPKEKVGRARQQIPIEIRQRLYENQNGECNGCEKHFESRNLNADHIKAFKLGGSDDESNLQLLCQSCNSTKGTNSQEYLKMILRQRGILQ